jgi:erythromycin esterase-like protein
MERGPRSWRRRREAALLNTVDPAAPFGDLVALRRSIGDAAIVGLGESTHGATQEITLKHRTLRLLVERMGFRSIAWEEDWTTGLQINQYIRVLGTAWAAPLEGRAVAVVADVEGSLATHPALSLPSSRLPLSAPGRRPGPAVRP